MCVVAMIRSGRLTSKNVSDANVQYAVQQLLSCSGRKSYLREVCSTVLADFVSLMPSKVFAKQLLPALEAELQCGWEKCSADQLLVIIKVNEHHSGVLSNGFFEAHWGNAEFLSTQNFTHFVEVLSKAGNVHSAKIHSAWIVLSKILLSDSKKFALFWKTAVDSALLTSTVERRFAAFQLAEAVLPEVPVSLLPVVLSAPLLKCVVRSLSSEKKYLHAAAKHLCESLVQIFQQFAEESHSGTADTAASDAESQLEGLVDVLLDLLWHPSRLLRSVVEEVFRGIVKHLTPAALDVIIAAVAGEDKDGDESSEEDDDDDEDEEDMSDESGVSDEGMSGREDEDSDEDDESSEEEVSDIEEDDSDAEFSSSLMKMDDGDSEEYEDEEMPEDPKEIARVDAQLAESFRHRVGMKNKQRAEKLNITHFRLRALDIIEIFIRRCQGSPLLLRLVLPLIDVTLDKATDGQSAALLEKSQGLLKSRLCKSRVRPLKNPDSLADAYTLLQRLVEMTAHAPTSAAGSTYTLAVMFVLRSLHASPSTQSSEEPKPVPDTDAAVDASKIVDVFAGPLEDFIKRKGSRLSPTLFTELVSRHPAVAWRLARVMATHLPDSANEFRRKEVCGMLSSLMSRRDAAQYSPLHLPSVSKQLRSALCTCLTQSAKNPDKVKAKNFRQLVLLAQHFLRLSKHCDDKLQQRNSSEIASALQVTLECELAKRSPELKALLIRVHSMCAET